MTKILSDARFPKTQIFSSPIPGIPQAGDVFPSVAVFLAKAALSHLGINTVRRCHGSNYSSVRCLGDGGNWVRKNGHGCPFEVGVTPDGEKRWVVDGERSCWSQSHGPDERIVADPNSQPQVRRLPATTPSAEQSGRSPLANGPPSAQPESSNFVADVAAWPSNPKRARPALDSDSEIEIVQPKRERAESDDSIEIIEPKHPQNEQLLSPSRLSRPRREETRTGAITQWRADVASSNPHYPQKSPTLTSTSGSPVLLPRPRLPPTPSSSSATIHPHPASPAHRLPQTQQPHPHPNPVPRVNSQQPPTPSPPFPLSIDDLSRVLAELSPSSRSEQPPRSCTTTASTPRLVSRTSSFRTRSGWRRRGPRGEALAAWRIAVFLNRLAGLRKKLADP